MKPRYIFLIFSIVVCLASIALVMIKGNPENRVSLDSVAEIGEGFLSSMNKVGTAFTPISDEEEMEVGNKIHERLLKSRITNQPNYAVLEKYINDVGNKVAENVKRTGIKYKFHIIESFYPSACSIAGGHVYVTTSLMKTLKSEAELAGVLAHEITHVDAKHCILSIRHKIQNEKITGSEYGALVDVGYDVFFKPGFSETQEIEADAGGVYLLYQAGYHPMAIIHAFERINKDELSRSNQDNSVTVVDDTLNAVGGMILRYFKTHPPTEDRINKIKNYISDNKLMSPNQRFYIGQENFKERISSKVKRYKEEFNKDYVITDEKKSESESGG